MRETMHRFCRTLLCLLVLPTAAYAASPATATKVLPLTVGRAVLIELPQAADTFFVAEPGIASSRAAKPDRILIAGKRAGITSVFALNAAGKVIYSADVHVSHDLTPMNDALRRDFPGLKLQLTSLPDGVAVSGMAPNSQTATQIVSLLDAFVKFEGPKGPVAPPPTAAAAATGDDKGGAAGTGTVAARNGRVINRMTIAESNQVTIRIRIAEVSRSVTERLGLKWNRLGSVNGNLFALAESPVSAGVEAALISSAVGALAGVKDITGIIDALAEEKLVSVLAEPNLSVLSGETASFLAGGQLPFPVLQDNDMGIEFKDYGVLLDITPTVLSNQRISLRVRPEVSEPDYANGIEMKGLRMPGFRVRRADTTVELASGQSFALAGLIQNDLTNQVAKVPGLGDLPILGALARSKEFQKGESELVIIATAYISQPTAAPLASPNETVKIGTPIERHLLDTTPEVSANLSGEQHAK